MSEYNGDKRPADSNAGEWYMFLTGYLDDKAANGFGLTFMAVQIAEAIDEAQERGRMLFLSPKRQHNPPHLGKVRQKPQQVNRGDVAP
jgi:hypothetical protein